MLRIDRNNKSLAPMKNQPLSDAGIRERYDLQQLIRKNPQAFFEDMKEEILLIGEELRPAAEVDDRIDLLAIDKKAALVVIELKRGSNHFQLLQALAYAAMISGWEQSEIIESLSKLDKIPVQDAKDKIESFLVEDISALNQEQRVILLAEDFEYEVLATAEWLTEKYSLDIRCYQLKLTTDEKLEYLSCTCIYPPPELKESARRRKRRDESSANWANWDSALETISNIAAKEFFLNETKAGCENNLNKRVLFYRLKNGKRQFSVRAHTQKAYVWQKGRFNDDISFWKKRLDSPLEIEAVNDDESLRFYLTTTNDFKSFKQAIVEELPKIKFLNDDEIEQMNG